MEENIRLLGKCLKVIEASEQEAAAILLVLISEQTEPEKNIIAMLDWLAELKTNPTKNECFLKALDIRLQAEEQGNA